MTHGWLPHTILRAASMLAPSEQRAEWLKGWRSELWYIPRREAARFCLGAFREAIWVRQNSVRFAWRTAFWFESPLSCLAFLAFVAIVSSIIVVCLPTPITTEMFLAFALALLPARITTGRGDVVWRHPASWPNRLHRGIFLLLKFALVLPVMVSGWVVMIWIGPAARAGLLAPIANYTLWFLTLRWVLLDQRNRCPECLRLLTEPVRIGASSWTFLEWYGSESACASGHGLLQIPEIPASYSGAEWHRLDGSWSGLF
jgi:hypothetical protein